MPAPFLRASNINVKKWITQIELDDIIYVGDRSNVNKFQLVNREHKISEINAFMLFQEIVVKIKNKVTDGYSQSKTIILDVKINFL